MITIIILKVNRLKSIETYDDDNTYIQMTISTKRRVTAQTISTERRVAAQEARMYSVESEPDKLIELQLTKA